MNPVAEVLILSLAALAALAILAPLYPLGKLALAWLAGRPTYFTLSTTPVAETREVVADRVYADYDAGGRLVGVEFLPRPR